MIYSYECPCGAKADIVKAAADYARTENCSTCGSVMRRVFSSRIYLGSTAVQEKKWQPALGRAATDSEMRSEAKKNDWIEVGTERPEKHLKPELSEYPNFTSEDIRALTSKP